jgi:hypothetical protein
VFDAAGDGVEDGEGGHGQLTRHGQLS